MNLVQGKNKATAVEKGLVDTAGEGKLSEAGRGGLCFRDGEDGYKGRSRGGGRG